MSYNVELAMKYIRNKLDSEWDGINFEYELKDDACNVKGSNITLRNHDDDIMVIITAYDGGMAYFRAVFDKCDKTMRSLERLNAFNASNIFFKAYIRNDDYLELRNVIAFYDEADLAKYADEVLDRLAKLADDEELQALTSLTHA
ncbi:MAG: YbjN domain-containing protein [Clostridia bacterium]|nr:YbjN domain-containing protein [Clostridia bacterium]